MMRRFTPSKSVAALAVTASLVLSGCGFTSDEGRPLTSLSPKGDEAQDIHNLAKPVFLIAGIIFVLVQGAIIFVSVKFRRRNDDTDALEPRQTHGNFTLEIMWTIAPAILLAGIGVLNAQTIWALEADEANPLTLEVIGHQWWWEYRYDTDSDGTADVITATQAVIPIDRQTDLKIRSNDVIHSFWIPALNGKKDAVPGRTNNWQVTPRVEGLFEGTCTEFCGLSHALMQMQVRVVSQDDFEVWLDEQATPAAEPEADTLAAAGKDVFFQQCASCHQVNGYDSSGAKTDGAADPAYQADVHPLLSGNAPNLTHLMSRANFAGGALELTENNLRRWVQNPAEVKPMAADMQRGMPTLPLTNEQLEAVVAYLMTLK